ncbi:MAG: hypothetical protein INQ03_22980 [Candidatus Heimdallarchaeota archaeon]|nr:hypothetical protein [Candidatus Heimdallarchaeota archaeon]
MDDMKNQNNNQIRNLNLLSIDGRKQYSNLSEDKFKEIKFNIIGKIRAELQIPSYDENEEKWSNEHSSYVVQFLSKLQEQSVSQKSRDLYQFITEYYLDECLFYFGKHVQHVNEVDIINLIFERYIRKVPLSKKEISLSLKALYQFYKFLYEIRVINEEILDFVNKLRKYKDSFDQRVNSKPSSGFFWDVDQNWHSSLLDFKEQKLKMYFQLTPLDLEPQPYVGMIESELSKLIEFDLVRQWRNSKGLSLKTITRELWNYSDTWFNTPKSFLKKLTPKDWIIIERSFLGEVPSFQ